MCRQRKTPAHFPGFCLDQKLIGSGGKTVINFFEKAFRLYEQGTVHASGLAASRCMQGVGRHGSMTEPALLALGPHLLSDVFAADVRLNLECSIPLGKLLGLLEVQPHPSFAPVAHKPQQT